MSYERIGFTGGKGGTGKSTVAVNVAALLAREKSVVLADMDVECPNDHLLLSAGELSEEQDVRLFNPVFDAEKCTRCGDCKAACAENAIVQFKEGMPFLLPQLCSGCRTCQIVCKYDAIGDGEKSVGKTYRKSIYLPGGIGLELVTGVLNVGEERSFPVAQATRARAMSLEADIYIFDTAAGTTNTVAESLLEVEALFAVAEPSPMGIHDLEMILQLADKMGIKDRYLIINKSTIGGREEIGKIEGLSREYDTPILATIPYSRSIVDSYVAGVPYVLYEGADSETLEQFQKIKAVIL